MAAAVSAWEAAAVAAALVGFSGVAAVSLSGLGVRLKTVLNIYCTLYKYIGKERERGRGRERREREREIGGREI